MRHLLPHPIRIIRSPVERYLHNTCLPMKLGFFRPLEYPFRLPQGSRLFLALRDHSVCIALRIIELLLGGPGIRALTFPVKIKAFHSVYKSELSQPWYIGWIFSIKETVSSLSWQCNPSIRNCFLKFSTGLISLRSSCPFNSYHPLASGACCRGLCVNRFYFLRGGRAAAFF